MGCDSSLAGARSGAGKEEGSSSSSGQRELSWRTSSVTRERNKDYWTIHFIRVSWARCFEHRLKSAVTRGVFPSAACDSE